MKIRIITVLACFAVGVHLNAQKLYIPRDIARAYSKGTRSFNGYPGASYWQNTGNYRITIDVHPPDRTVSGHESITYRNNSPDTLSSLLFKLITNIHKPGAPRAVGASADYLSSGIVIDSFSINGISYSWNNAALIWTNKRVTLKEKLLPGSSAEIYFKWHYDISVESGREGAIDSTTFYLAYFYPRVSVYDDYAGWDIADFNDALEMYNDFNDYRVTINVPKNFIVWGTGKLENPEQVLAAEFADRYRKSLSSDELVHIASAKDLNEKQVTLQRPVLSWIFSGNNIPDVAFGISDHFVWDASSMKLNKNSPERISVQSAYNDTASDYRHMIGFIKQSMRFLCDEWPAVPYPYEKMTVFQGYAGMEYPMMVNDESYTDTVFSRFVAFHEIAHTYMPFYMGINETRYGFMDEGWATTFELLFHRTKMPLKEADDFYNEFRVSAWSKDISPQSDLPLITPGPNLSTGSRGHNQYGKPSLGYFALKDILGDQMFKKALHTYMNAWNGKHPTPWDFFYIMNTTSGKDLNWFWRNWFFSQNYIDLAAENVQWTGKQLSVTVKNIGGLAVPFDLQVEYTDGSSRTEHISAGKWQNNEGSLQVRLKETKKIKSIQLSTGIFMDSEMKNNRKDL